MTYKDIKGKTKYEFMLFFIGSPTTNIEWMKRYKWLSDKYDEYKATERDIKINEILK